MNIIVTGGSGFLGRHLCRALAADGHTVTVLDLHENPEFTTHILDVRDAAKNSNLFEGVDVVYHLAAKIEAGESVTHPNLYFDHNVMGTLSVLEAMKQAGVSFFLFSSSAAIYGEPQRVPIHEDDRTLPVNPYGVTKLAMEGLVNSYVATSGITGVGLRYFNLYGPEEHHEPESHAIPRFIQQIYSGTEVTVWGDGAHKRDFVYIHDIVTAHVLALKYAQTHQGTYHYYNLSAEQPCSVRDVIEKVAIALGKPAHVRHFPNRPGDPLLLYADASKARTELGWEASVSLDAGIQETVKYFTDLWMQDE